MDQLFQFDEAYVHRLREGDAKTEQHFVAYFDPLLRIMLRARFIPSDKIDDLIQDTFTRVIATVRRAGGVRQPERFGAFVKSVAKNVLHEFYRSLRKTDSLDDCYYEIPDRALDLDAMLMTDQIKSLVANVLKDMPSRDRELLTALFLEERDKDEICRSMGLNRDYLRVRLLRAKGKFRHLLEKHHAGSPARAGAGGMP